MITLIETMFAFESIGFWLLIAALFIGTVASIEQNRYFLPIFIGGLFTYAYWGSLTALNPINWHFVAIFGLLYIVLGVVYSIFRWYEHVKEIVSHAKLYLTENPNSAGYSAEGVRGDLNLRYYKGKITGWIVYWPFSLTWYLTHTLLHNLINCVYESVTDIYNSITERAIKDLPKKGK